MGAVAFRTAALLRRTWRGTLALAVIVSLVGGTIVACVAGARRTDAALGRFLRDSRPADAIVDGPPEAIDALVGHPAVADLDRALLYAVAPVGLWEERFVPFAVSLDGGVLHDLARPIVVEGRLPDPAAPDEVVLREGIADLLDARAGDVVEFESLTDEGVATISENQGDGTGAEAGPSLDMRVVGVVRDPADLAARASDQPFHHLTPAFHDRWEGRIGTFGAGAFLRLRPGHDVADVSAALAHVDGEVYVEPWPGSAEAVSHRLRPTIDLLRNAVLAFGAVLALAAAVALVQAQYRSAAARSEEASLLAALGLPRRPRVASLAAPGALAGAAAVPGAFAVAVLLSAAFPVGLARRAEVDPGLEVDALVVLPGSVLVGVAVAVAAVLGAVRADRLASPGRRSRAVAGAGSRRWTLPAWAGSPAAMLGRSLTTGAGAGRSSLSPRVGAAAAAAGISAAVVFGASLSTLLSTPRLYGWTWDIGVEGTENDPVRLRSGVDPATDPAVAEVSTYVAGLEVDVDGRPAFAFASGEGDPGGIGPVVSTGRAPVAGDEVALGGTTLDRLGRSVGDEITVRSNGEEATFRIVGQAVVPVDGDGAGRITEGVSLTLDGLRRLGTEPSTACERDELCTRQTAVRFVAGADVEAALDRLVGGGDLTFAMPSPPGEVQRLAEIDAAPELLAASLALLGATAVGHAVISAVRRRRRELGVARSLGFTRRQTEGSVLVLAVGLAGVGSVAGTVVGVVAGRALWRTVALDVGARPETSTPWLLVGLPVAVVVVAGLVAAAPAHLAGRMRPAEILRTE